MHQIDVVMYKQDQKARDNSRELKYPSARKFSRMGKVPVAGK